MVYLGQSQDIPTTLKIEHQEWRVVSGDVRVSPKLLTTEDVRTVILTGLPSQRNAYIYYLYWFIETDLSKIDTKIETGLYSEADFHNCIIVNHELTFCHYDHAHQFHTLVISHLGQMIRSTDHIPILSCPSCGNSFRHPVVKILEQVAS